MGNGTRVAFVCPNCRTEMEEKQHWCPKCKTEVTPTKTVTFKKSGSTETGIIGFLSDPFELCLKICSVLIIVVFTIAGSVTGYFIGSEEYLKYIFAVVGLCIGFFIGWLITSLTFGLVFSFLDLKHTCENINKQLADITEMLNKK